jgi:hypothetical protein
MAHLGLLRSGIAVAAVAMGHLGCSIGPIWAREFHGRVEDYQTHDPVDGVEVFLSTRINYLGDHGAGGVNATRWGTTDENGEFVLDGEFQIWFMPLAVTDDPPSVTLYHPDYGLMTWPLLDRNGFGPDRFPGPGEAFQIRPEKEIMAERRLTCDWQFASDWLTTEACWHLIDVVRRSEPNHPCAHEPPRFIP